jgi:ubiquitin C-terminal hydrolase
MSTNATIYHSIPSIGDQVQKITYQVYRDPLYPSLIRVLLPRVTGTLIHSAARITDCALALILAVNCTIKALCYKAFNAAYPIQDYQEITNDLLERAQELTFLFLFYLSDIPTCLICNLVSPQLYQEIISVKTTIVIPSPIPSFNNAGANCAFNACLQVIFHNPEFCQIYEKVALYCKAQADEDDQVCGENMLSVLKSYNDNTDTPKDIPSDVSQKMRLAMHHLNKTISKSSSQHEDAHEILLTLFSKYEGILQENAREILSNNSEEEIEKYIIDISSIHFKKTIIRRFAIGNIIPIPESIPSELNPDNTLIKEEMQYQLVLSLNDSKDHLKFSEILKDFFCKKEQASVHVNLMKNETCFQAKLIEEEQKFSKNPNYLIIQFARFSKLEERFSKIDVVINDIPEKLDLRSFCDHICSHSTYELTSFITHFGELAGGHYIAYRKLENKWIKCNDRDISYANELSYSEDLQKSYLCFYKLTLPT